MNMTHPDILWAERTGVPMFRSTPAPAEMCDCGRYTHNAKICGFCGHSGCSRCMTYDDNNVEWFCGDECREKQSTNTLRCV